jgi:hypothetical protein
VILFDKNAPRVEVVVVVVVVMHLPAAAAFALAGWFSTIEW